MESPVLNMVYVLLVIIGIAVTVGFFVAVANIVKIRKLIQAIQTAKEEK